MKAFRIALLVVLCAVTVGFAGTATYNTLRVNGSSTPAGGVYVWNTDHTDSLSVDTFTSETLSVLQSEYVNIGYQITDWTACDSCADSVSFIVQTLTSFNGTNPIVIHTDTFGTDGTITDGEVLQFNFSSDTLLYNNLFIRTILTDSVGMDADSTADSTHFNILYHVIQRPY